MWMKDGKISDDYAYATRQGQMAVIELIGKC